MSVFVGDSFVFIMSIPFVVPNYSIVSKVLFVLKTVFIFRHAEGLILTTFIKGLLSLELYIRLFSRQINNSVDGLFQRVLQGCVARV